MTVAYKSPDPILSGHVSRGFRLPAVMASRTAMVAILALLAGIALLVADGHGWGGLLLALLLVVIAAMLASIAGVLTRRCQLAESRLQDMSEALSASEQRLMQYQTFFTRAMDALPVAVSIKNSDLKFSMVNQAYCELGHCSPEQMIGRSTRELLGREASELVEAMDTAALASGKVQHSKEWLTNMDGGQRYLRVTKCRSIGMDDQPVVVSTYEDLTQLREQEQQQSSLRAFLQHVFDALPNALFVKDHNHRYIMTNRVHIESNGGTTPEHILGKSSKDFSPEIADDIEAAERRLFADPSNGLDEREYVLIDPQGRPHNTLIRKATCVGPDGNLVIVGLTTDITDLRATERDLRRALQRYSMLIENAPLGIALLDVDGHFMDANPALQAMIGYSVDELKTLDHRSISPTREAVLDRIKIEEIFAKGNCQPFEKHYVRKDGREVPVMVSGVVVKEAWQTTQIWGLVQDMTERRKAEQEIHRHRDHLQELVHEQTVDLVSAKETAERASEAKSAFLANMSHELRTPMHAILSFARLGENKAGRLAPEKLAEYFERIRSSGERLMALLNDLLDLSKLEAGRMIIEPRPICLKAIIDEVTREYEAWLSAKYLSLDIEVEAGLPLALADPQRIGQVLRNLLSNAIKFSPSGRAIRISLRKAELRTGRRSEDQGAIAAVECAVADDGIGIPQEELELVFEKFVQSSTTRNGAGGTGLGLSICREIIEAHRGQIFARSRAEGGTEFVLKIPAQNIDAQTVAPVTPRKGDSQ